MNRTTTLRLLALAALPFAAAQAQTIYLNETFETDTIGAAPTDAAQKRNTLVTVVAGSGVIGTDNALRFNDTSTTAGGAIEYNLGSSALDSLFISFDIANNAANNTGTAANPLIFGVAAFNTSTGTVLSSNAARYFGLEFYQTGASSTLRIRNNAGSAIFSGTYDMAAQITVKVFINDKDSATLDYLNPATGTTSTLNSNSAVIFINDTLFSTQTASGFSFSSVAASVGDSTLGRMGFNSSSTVTSDFLIDNVYASTIPTAAIPEPSAFAALAGLGVLGLAASRRRRA